MISLPLESPDQVVSRCHRLLDTIAKTWTGLAGAVR